MKVQELREMSADQLQEALIEARKEQFNLRMQQSRDEGQKPHLHKEVRHRIARIKTIMREAQGGKNA